MRPLAALLVVLLAAPAPGQAPCDVLVVEVATGSIRTLRDVQLAVRGGAYLPQESHICVAKELAALRAENRVLREAPVATPTVVVVATSIAFLLGAGVGLAVWTSAR